MSSQDHIRNFAIIAHIDHGKSTLADRLLEITHTVAMRDMQAQILDSNPIERERGITIKLAPVRMHYSRGDKGLVLGITQKPNVVSPNTKYETPNTIENYILNLIDTPGHVDFGYEVSRSLAACEGAILVVDATQGVQAQTLANLHQARAHNLTIIPVINKIDMPHARISETREELRALDFRDEEMIEISAKTGENVEKVLEAVIEKIPPPTGNSEKPLRALIFSSQYDTHKGVVIFVRVVDGTLPFDTHTSIRFMFSNASITPIEVGFFMPQMLASEAIKTGEVGYVATGLKDVRFAKVGDTVTVGRVVNATVQPPTAREPLAGYKEPKSMVFVSLFPIQTDAFSRAREAMEKLRLSDSAFNFRPISSLALGNGFHCGFLGLLHAEIVQERLSREFDLNMIATAPSVEYHLTIKSGVSLSKLGLTASNIIDEAMREEGGSRVTRIEGLPSSARSPAATGDTEQENSGVSANEKTRQIKQKETGEDVGREKSAAGPDVRAAEVVNEHLDPSSVLSRNQSVSSIQSFSLANESGQNVVHSPPRGTTVAIQSAAEYPDPTVIEGVREPIMEVKIFTPKQYVGAVMQLSEEKRGEYIDLKYVGEQAEFTYLIPLSEMIVDFFDRLKSVSEGYASLDYNFFEYQAVSVAKVDILVNKEKVDALSFLAVESQARHRAIAIVERLADVIPRQQFQIPIQGAIGGQVIARSDVKAFRKDVIQKLYGGDRTRKDKLLEAQKKGKERMKLVGRVEIPQSAFFEVLKRE